MTYCLIALTLVLVAASPAPGRALTQAPARDAAQSPESEPQPLTLAQVEQMIRNRGTGPDELPQDRATAAELDRAGVAFPLDAPTLERLRKLGAGPLTLRALESLRISAQRVLILVADFGGGPEAEAVTERLFERLTEFQRRHPNIEVRALGKRLSARLGWRALDEERRRQRADILIWGRLEKTDEEVTVVAQFEVGGGLRQAGGRALYGVARTLSAKLADFKSFSIRARLSNELATVALFAAGLTRLKAHDNKAAVALFTEALNQQPPAEGEGNSSQILTARAVAYMYSEGFNSRNAINDFDAALKADPKNLPAIVYAQGPRVVRRDYWRAMSDVRSLLEQEPGHEVEAIGNVLLGIYELARGEDAAANRYFDKAIGMLDGYSAAPAMTAAVGMAYALRGEHERGQLLLDNAIERSDSVQEQVNFRGLKAAAYERRGDYERAIRQYEEVLRLDENAGHTYAFLGKCYATKGDHAKAIEYFTLYLERGHATALPVISSADVHLSRAEAYRLAGLGDKALDDYSRALALDPGLTKALEARAGLYMEMRRWGEAAADYEEFARRMAAPSAPLGREASHNADGPAAEPRQDQGQGAGHTTSEARAYVARAKYHLARSERERAVADLTTALRLAKDADLREEILGLLKALGMDSPS